MSSVGELPVIAASVSAASVINVPALEAELRRAVSGEVRFDRGSRALYSTDASVYQIVPLGVVLPRTEADIQATLEICRRFCVPLTARGGGTGQAGQAIGPGVVLDCSKFFNRVLEINPAERWVRVQPGCVLDDLNLELKPHGLHFAPDISTANRATIGGMVANNSSGTRSVIYGKTIDQVAELRVLLADGSIVSLGPRDNAAWEATCNASSLLGQGFRVVRQLAQEHGEEIGRRFPKVLRRVGGYNLDRFTADGPLVDEPHLSPTRNHSQPRRRNLAHLFVGSEGTLGITLEAKLHLVALPKAKGLVVIHFTDLLDALAATPLILRHGPSAVEVTDRYILDSTKRNAEAARLRDFIQGEPDAILIVEFYGDMPAEVAAKVQAVSDDLRQHGFGYHFHVATDAAAQGKVWKLRKLSLGLSMLEKGDAKAISFVEDTAVAPEKLRDYIAEFLALVRRHGTKAGVYAHASVGCLHVRPVINLKTVEGVQRFRSIAEEVADLVLKYGGALSGEHGDGLVRSPFMARMFGPTLYDAFRQIKRIFDPHNLLNPGKIVDAPPLTNQLRYGPTYRTPTVPTVFDFSADGGIVQAAELCAGVGECRKKREGGMCPSYRATAEEQHSTRGRANTLRLALTGQLSMDGLTDPAVKEALDLCLECKACKSECPTNVDMARLKAEFLHQYHKKHGLPWRNWLFGNVGRLPWLTPPAWWLRSRWGRWLNEKLFGIDRRRVPPVRQPLPADYPAVDLGDPAQVRAANRGASPPVLLFPDTLAEHYEPRLLHDSFCLLTALGSSVVVGSTSAVHGFGPHEWPSRLRCCGRPMISNGMLDQAVANARHNVERLYPWATAGKPITACEPSCILTIKDDYPALLRGEERRKAEVVAAACQTMEERLEMAIAARSSPASLRPGPKRVLVQAHCHQQALVGVGPLLKVLRRIPDAEVIDLDAGCCGMAGSFGYETEHYEVSRLVGEHKLFPALRKADSETVIVAPGFSCRMQIEHFAGRKAVHPAELVASLLSETDNR
ncbi:MAG: FAD-binding protein [Planctomycetia bacterium]|nr:FAD-binding protein [Planctomycetia bacterium]